MDIDQPEELNFDLEAYASNYISHAKIDRLIFIAEKSFNTPLELEALKLAADELKKTENTSRYLEVMKRINNRLGPAYAVDRDWVDLVDSRAAQKQDKLETELNHFKTNLIKESIRMGHNELGDFFYERGDLQNAFKSYVRTRDYCTTSRHIIKMCLHIVKVALEMNNYIHVQNYVQKAEQTPEVMDPVIAGKIKCAAGLLALETKKYRTAARRFTEVSPELGSQWCEVIAPQDLALYGGLCALASFDRQELKAKVIDNVGFREMLELVPEVRELISDFYASRYTPALNTLERLQRQLALDVHLHSHVAALYGSIRSRALIQYTVPFTSVNLHTMAAAFNTDVSGIESELADLIMSGQVKARIDSHAKVLYARSANLRNATFHTSLQQAEDCLRTSRALLLRASIMQHDMVQRGQPMQGGGRHQRAAIALPMPERSL